MPHRKSAGCNTSAPLVHDDPPRPAICVFCGSSPGDDPAYAEVARDLGRAIGERGFALIFGGGGLGLMGTVARAARDAGAPVTGILPGFLKHLEPPLESGETVVITPDLQLRKKQMLATAEAFVILPGGLGTLDEYFEVITSTQLSVLAKPIVVVDVKSYFAPMRALLDHVIAHGFAKPTSAAHQVFVPTVAEAMAVLEAEMAPRP